MPFWFCNVVNVHWCRGGSQPPLTLQTSYKPTKEWGRGNIGSDSPNFFSPKQNKRERESQQNASNTCCWAQDPVAVRKRKSRALQCRVSSAEMVECPNAKSQANKPKAGEGLNNEASDLGADSGLRRLLRMENQNKTTSTTLIKFQKISNRFSIIWNSLWTSSAPVLAA